MKLSIPNLSQTESLLVIGIVGAVVYLGYKASQAAGVGLGATVRAANRLGQTVANTADNAYRGGQDGLQDALRYNPITASTSQAIYAWQNRGAFDYSRNNMNPDAPWAGMEDDYTEPTPDSFGDAYKRMQKPSYEELSQPSTGYPS